MILSPLYHWSPRGRRKQIVRFGLVPGKPPTTGTVRTVEDGRHVVCLCPDPIEAWGLSGRFEYAPGLWDLWSVVLVQTDAVFVRPHWGPHVKEVRVANRIPKSRLRWVGERHTDSRQR